MVIFALWSESRLGESAARTVLVLTVAVFLPVYRRFRKPL